MSHAHFANGPAKSHTSDAANAVDTIHTSNARNTAATLTTKRREHTPGKRNTKKGERATGHSDTDECDDTARDGEAVGMTLYLVLISLVFHTRNSSLSDG